MRDLVFKNLTSRNKRRKVISSSEVFDRQGVHSAIRRHFIWMIKEVKEAHPEKPLPYMYILKQHNSKEQKEKFFCKMKGSLYAIHGGRLFLITFMHSLNISLECIANGSVK